MDYIIKNAFFIRKKKRMRLDVDEMDAVFSFTRSGEREDFFIIFT